VDLTTAIQHTRAIALPTSADAIAISGDGTTIVAACDQWLLAFAASSGEELQRWKQQRTLVDVCASANGQHIAATSGSTLIDVYDRGSGKRVGQLHRNDAPDFLRNDGQQRIAFFPDGSKVVSSGTRSRSYLSDVETGNWDHIVWMKYDTCTPVVSPDGKHVALVGMRSESELSGQVTMYRVRRGLQPLWTKWHESEEAVTHAAFSEDGLRLASCGAGDGTRVWNVNSGELVAHLMSTSEDRPLGISFTANGNHLLLVLDRKILVQSVDRQEIEASVDVPEREMLRGAACSNDGTVIATLSGNSKLNVWSVTRP